MNNLIFKKAAINELQAVVSMLQDDERGKTREDSISQNLEECYVNAFYKIDSDPNQYLMVCEFNSEIVGTCHLTIMPSLAFMGSTRLQIEAVRVIQKFRRQKIGKAMINAAIDDGKNKGVKIMQLSTNKQRVSVKRFYENLGFEATHEGMKLYL